MACQKLTLPTTNANTAGTGIRSNEGSGQRVLWTAQVTAFQVGKSVDLFTHLSPKMSYLGAFVFSLKRGLRGICDLFWRLDLCGERLGKGPD